MAGALACFVENLSMNKEKQRSSGMEQNSLVRIYARYIFMTFHPEHMGYASRH